MLKHSFFLWITDMDKKSENIFSVFHSLWCAFVTMLSTNTFPVSGVLSLTSLRGQRCNIERETNRLLDDCCKPLSGSLPMSRLSGRTTQPGLQIFWILDCFWCITHASKAKILIIKTACSDDSDSSMLLCKCVRSQEVCSPSPVHNACVPSCAWPEHTSSGNGQRLWYHMHDLHSLISAGWNTPVPLSVRFDLDCLINRNIASENKLG